MEVEARWKWKVDGSGSAIVTAPNGPNEPPYKLFPRFDAELLKKKLPRAKALGNAQQ